MWRWLTAFMCSSITQLLLLLLINTTHLVWSHIWNTCIEVWRHSRTLKCILMATTNSKCYDYYITRCYVSVIVWSVSTAFSNDFGLNGKVVDKEQKSRIMLKTESAVNHDIMNKLRTVISVPNLILKKVFLHTEPTRTLKTFLDPNLHNE